MEENKKTNGDTSSLKCFLFMARYKGVSVEEEQLKHILNLESEYMSFKDMLKGAKNLGLMGKVYNGKFEELSSLPMPMIMESIDKRYFLLVKIENKKALIYDVDKKIPESIMMETLKSSWSGYAFILKKKGFLKDDVDFGFKWFIPSIIKFKKPLIVTLVAVFVMQILGIFTPVLTQVIIDKALTHNSIATLDVFALGIGLVIIFEFILGLTKNNVFINTTSKIDVILGARLYSHLFSLPLRYFESRRIGDTIARVREVDNIRSFLTGTPMTAILDVAFIIVYVIVMFIYSIPLTAIVLLSLPIFAIFSLIITPIFRHRLDERFGAGADSQSFLVETVTGVETVKALAMETKMQGDWEDRLAAFAKANYKTAVLSNHANTIGQFIERFFDLLILWFGARLVMSGDLTIGALVAFRMLSSRVSTPVLRLVQLWKEFQQASLSVRRLGDIFNSKPEPKLNSTKSNLPPLKGDISFDKVVFRYNTEQYEVVRNISFDIKAGSVIGIVGKSGSGKSTIAKLIQRLYIPERGKISIDGFDISLIDPIALRRQIGVVLQENFLFNMTVRENIALHYPSASMDKIINSAKIAGAHDFILELQDGYDTNIGEKGIGLSGGQKQRVAIARALLSNPKILIFDEATSALDYESESIIQNNLKKICEGRTVIIIAHRLSTIKDADKIMVIDKGELVEFGTSVELIDNKGIFYKLKTMQDGGEVIER